MPTEAKNEAGVETKKVMCWQGPGCGAACRVLVDVKDGKIVGRRPDKEGPSKGFVCGKRYPHLLKWLEHPDQLMHPLKRKGERGENKWERISWDQAFDEIGDKLKKLKAQYGGECLTVNEGTYRSDLYGIRARFLNLFGNPGNVGSAGTSCMGCKRAVQFALGGAPTGFNPIEGRKCLVYCGLNMSGAFPEMWPEFKHALNNTPKPKVIVIDPRLTELAEKADIWLQSRPGTDAAMFLAWINVIIEEGLYDKSFIDEWTFGFDQLKQRASEYTPERVAEITWIPAEKIRECARIYALNKPASIMVGLSADQIGLNGMRAYQASLCLHAITGNMQISGMPTGPGPIINGNMGILDCMLQLDEKLPQEQKKKQLGSERFKLMGWPAYEITSKLYKEVYGVKQCMSGHNFACHQPLVWRAILEKEPYPIKAMITWGANPMLNAPDTKLVYKALKSPNLDVHVAFEYFMTPTALLADYVLPAASKFEKPSCSTHEDWKAEFTCGERAIEPMGERKSDYDIWRGLAIRMGYGDYFPWQSDEELNDYKLAPLGITFKEATERYIVKSSEKWTYKTINPRTGKPTGFATPSGKYELYSNVLKELGYDPLPFYEEPPESPIRTPDVAKDFPLILNTGGHFMPMYHSEHRQLGMGLREQHPDPLMDIHSDTARELGIADGDWVYIETRRGVIKQKAHVTTGIHPKVVNVEASWWFPEQPAQEPWLHGVWQSNANVLSISDPDACDPLTGGWAFRALQCKVYKVLSP